MLGAIIGDIVGSRWEFNPTNNYAFELFSSQNSFTDDTICTLAVADALLHGSDNFGAYIHSWCRRHPHPMGGYGGRFAQWVKSDTPHPYGSYGNGSAMRVSPVAWACSDSDQVLALAGKSAACTHNHPLGISGAQAVALAIFDCRQARKSGKYTSADQVKEQGLKRAIHHFGRPVQFDWWKVQNHFDETCEGTVPVAFWIINQSHSFEDAIRRAVSLGADADTLGAIVGSIAEAIWPIPEWIKKKALAYLPDEMRQVLKDFRKIGSGKHTSIKQSKEEAQKQQFIAMMHWKLGLGNLGNVMIGKSPLPEKMKRATAADWQTEPMSDEDVSDMPFDFRIPAKAMSIIRKGHIPEVQEDHWFMYCDRSHIRYYRSWTGCCAFEAHYRKEGTEYVVDNLKVNHALVEFGVNGDDAGAALFRYLIVAECGGDAAKAWQDYVKAWEKLATNPAA